MQSHPMWVRGLKRITLIVLNKKNRVAPHVGAWIETTMYEELLYPAGSHPMWVRGLKHTYSYP